MPIQGTAADIIKIAMIRVNEELRAGGYASKLILQVHDELLIDAVNRTGRSKSAFKALYAGCVCTRCTIKGGRNDRKKLV